MATRGGSAAAGDAGDWLEHSRLADPTTKQPRVRNRSCFALQAGPDGLGGLGESPDPAMKATISRDPSQASGSSANAGRQGEGGRTFPLQAEIQHTVHYTELAPDRFRNFWCS
jgi:hypothetical protein